MLVSAGLGGIILDDLKKTWSQQALNRWWLLSMFPGDVVGREEERSKALSRPSTGGKGKTQKMKDQRIWPWFLKQVPEEAVNSREEDEDGVQKKSWLIKKKNINQIPPTSLFNGITG